MRFPINWLLVLVVSLLFMQLDAQVDPLENKILDSLWTLDALDHVVIAENRIKIPFSDNSRSIDLLTKKDIQESKATNLNEVLQLISGVDVRQRGVGGVQADISIRGGTFEQSIIMLNGLKLVDPQTGHHMMNVPIDISAIERIEVLKGPAARIYGMNAYAGAINIITKVPESTTLFVGLEYGSFESVNATINASMPIGDKYDQRLSAAYNTSDGYRDNSDYDIANVFYESNLKIGESKLNFFGGYVDRSFGANGFYGNEFFTEQFETVQTAVTSLNLETKIKDWTLAPRISWRQNKDNWQFIRSDPEFFQNFHTTDVYSAEVHGSRSHRLGILGVGAEYISMNLESSNLKDSLGVGDHAREQLGLHFENRFLLADEKLDITPGILILKVTDYDVKYFPGLDLGYRVSNSIKSFLNIGWTTRIPTFTDLFYQDSGNEGNPNLQEENAFTGELGLSYRQSNIFVRLSVFSRRASEQIDWFRISENDKWTPDNFNSATYNGIDFTTTISGNSGSSFNSITIGYNYLNASFEDNDFAFSRNQLENLRHQLIIRPTFQYEDAKLFISVLYNDRVSLEDYVLVNFNISYTFKEHEFYLKANNIYDVSYRETNLVEMPGRWFSGGVRLQLF